VGIAAALMASSSCRSPVPDEHVYTGRGETTRTSGGVPSLPPATTGGVPPGAGGGASGGAGGKGSQPGEGGGGLPEAGSAGVGGAEPPDPPSVAFTKAALLAAEGDCTLRELRGFLSLAEALRDRCTELSNAHSAERVDAARGAFRAAMSAWQMLEVHRYGPAARKGDDPAAGQDLRDEIYAWPLGGRCNVDQQLVNKGYAQPGFAAQLINVRGLGTLEYLLFNEEASNGCPSYSPLNAQGTWAALGLEELRTRKAEYARVVADDVLAHATALVAAWEGGRFREQLIAAGSAGSPYASEQAALNAVSNALFYVERELKDKKLALPLGISPDCTSGLCPESLESQYAGLSTENIRQNLRGFRQLFWGCGPRASGLGFDDWLIEVGAGDLERRMAAAFEAATVAFEQLDPPLERALLSKPEATSAVYQALKRFTDLLKTEFVSALQLELPTGTETDND
jgi:predicted lipoprotein